MVVLRLNYIYSSKCSALITYTLSYMPGKRKKQGEHALSSHRESAPAASLMHFISDRQRHDHLLRYQSDLYSPFYILDPVQYGPHVYL